MKAIDKKLFEYLGIIYMTHSGDKNFQRVHGDIWVLPTLEKRGFHDVGTSCIVLRELSNIDDCIKLSTVPTIADLHKWMNYHHVQESIGWAQHSATIYTCMRNSQRIGIPYDSSLPLMQQSDATKEAILQLILGEYGNN